MLGDHFETGGGSGVQIAEIRSSGKSLDRLTEIAHRLSATLTVADALTEKPQLTEMESIALDVLLAAGLDDVRELIRQIEKLSAAEWGGEKEARA
jgi:hypothetical protein